jgi:hypothetical protein
LSVEERLKKLMELQRFAEEVRCAGRVRSVAMTDLARLIAVLAEAEVDFEEESRRAGLS